MANLQVELVAPEGKLWEGEAHLVRARSVEGELGIMAGHEPMLAALAPGEVIIRADGDSDSTVEVDGGFLTVDDDRVTIVAESLQHSDS